VDADEEINDAVDAANMITAITSPEASSTTMQLVPRSAWFSLNSH